MGGGGVGGGAKYSPPPEPPPKLRHGPPQCFAQLKTRAVQDPRAQLIGATHSFWYVQDSLGNQAIISGGPQSGFLDVFTNWNNPQAGVDNGSASTTWNSGVSANSCGGTDALVTAAQDWPQDTIPYSWSGPNSNSVANYLGTVGGFNPPAPPVSVGWNTPIPSIP